MNLDLTEIFCSKIRCLNTCQRKYFWVFIMKLAPTLLYVPFFVGTMVHIGIHKYFTTDWDIDRLICYIERKTRIYLSEHAILPEEMPKITIQCALVEGMLRGFYQYKGKARDTTTVIASEQSYAIPLPVEWNGTSIEFIGTVDMLDKPIHAAKAQLSDWKTAAEINYNKLSALDMNLQMNSYPVLVERASGLKIDCWNYFVIAKPKIRQKKNQSLKDYCREVTDLYTNPKTNPDYFYAAMGVTDAVTCMKAFQDVCLAAQQLKVLHDRDEKQVANPSYWLRNDQQCVSVYGRCSYFDLCKYGCTPKTLEKFKEANFKERGVVIRKSNV